MRRLSNGTAPARPAKRHQLRGVTAGETARAFPGLHRSMIGRIRAYRLPSAGEDARCLGRPSLASIIPRCNSAAHWCGFRDSSPVYRLDIACFPQAYPFPPVRRGSFFAPPLDHSAPPLQYSRIIPAHSGSFLLHQKSHPSTRFVSVIALRYSSAHWVTVRESSTWSQAAA